MKNVVNHIFVCICALVVLVPVLFYNGKPDQISKAENRKLAELGSPKDGLSVFMTGVTSYVNDRIGFRDEAVQLYRNIAYKHLNFRHNKVLVGEDSWLFYFDDIPDYTGANNTPANVERCIAVLKRIDAWCKERDIQFVFAVGPNKSTIYSDYMPGYVKPADVTLLDSLLERAAQEDLTVICPKQALLAHKDQQELYMRLDTHWSPLGSRFMLEQLLDALELPAQQIPLSPTQTTVGDLQDMLAIGELGVNSVTADVPLAPGAAIEAVPNTKHLHMYSENTAPFVCYRDSFTEALDEYYTYYFNGPLYWTFAIDFEQVEKLQPKYLILECVERYLLTAIDDNAAVLG